jgi:hypothetical protein
MNTAEGTQEVAHRRPHALGGVDMHFTDAIAVIVACPFLLAMTNRRVQANDVIVTSPFIGEYHSISQGEHMDVMNQGLFVSVVNDSQAHLPALTPDCADNGRSIIVVGAMSPLFVGSLAAWIVRIVVTFAFFPPRSETSRPFQSVGLAKGPAVAAALRWLGSPCAYRVPFGDSRRSRAQWPLWAHLCISHASAERPALAGSAFPRTLSHCTDCKCPDKDTGIRSIGSSWSCGTPVPPPRPFRNEDISTGSGESTSTAKPCSDRHLVGLQLESPCW